jgi:FkbM family methyltransferase
MRLGHRVTDLIQRFGQSFGLHLTRVENTLPFKRHRFIRDLKITLVLDVGANVGTYAQALRSGGFAGRIASFEPIAEAFSLLREVMHRDRLWFGRHLALGDVVGNAWIHVSHNVVSSSLLKVTEASVDAYQSSATNTTEQISITRLDSVLPEFLASGDRIYLKLDVQGFERQVLLGAEQSFAHIEAIELELSLVELYEGQALLPEMFQLLDELGYEPAWLERGFKDASTGRLLQMDGIFIRRPKRVQVV